MQRVAAEGKGVIIWKLLPSCATSTLSSWHRYLLTYRDPEASGLVTIYHPWESGTDNSPRWDAALEPVEAGEVSPHERYDLEHVDDPS